MDRKLDTACTFLHEAFGRFCHQTFKNVVGITVGSITEVNDESRAFSIKIFMNYKTEYKMFCGYDVLICMLQQHYETIDPTPDLLKRLWKEQRSI